MTGLPESLNSQLMFPESTILENIYESAAEAYSSISSGDGAPLYVGRGFYCRVDKDGKTRYLRESGEGSLVEIEVRD